MDVRLFKVPKYIQVPVVAINITHIEKVFTAMEPKGKYKSLNPKCMESSYGIILGLLSLTYMYIYM